MAKLSYPELKDLVDTLVTEAKLSNASFTATRDNIVGLLDKVGKIVMIDTVSITDKLPELSAENLPYGKIIEEWSEDLILPEDHDPTGAGAMSPHDPTYRPVFYSYTLGRKKFPVTIRNNEIERAVNNGAELVDLVSRKLKTLEVSEVAYKYQVKREMIGKFIELIEGALDNSTAVLYSALTSASAVGTVVKDDATATAFGILVKSVAVAPASWDAGIENGNIIVYDLKRVIAKPVDTSTGEAFITQVKEDIEVASDLSEGHSMNGNTLGAVEGLFLIVKQGVIPSLEVDTYAGAFNKSDLAIPATLKIVKDFGSADDKYYAILVDSRSMRLFNTYSASRENANGDGDFLNVFKHTEDTAAISRNCFVKVYSAS